MPVVEVEVAAVHTLWSQSCLDFCLVAVTLCLVHIAARRSMWVGVSCRRWFFLLPVRAVGMGLCCSVVGKAEEVVPDHRWTVEAERLLGRRGSQSCLLTRPMVEVEVGAGAHTLWSQSCLVAG
jgi:hypothetical protein